MGKSAEAVSKPAIFVRATDGEIADIKAAAEKAEKSVNEWSLAVLLAAARGENTSATVDALKGALRAVLNAELDGKAPAVCTRCHTRYACPSCGEK